MQVYLQVLVQRDPSINQRSLYIGIFLDNFSPQNGFFNVLSLEAFPKRVLHGVAFDQVVSCLYTLANVLYIHLTIPVEDVNTFVRCDP